MKQTEKVNGNGPTRSSKKYWQSVEERNSPEIATWRLPEFNGSSIDELRQEARKKGITRKNFIKLMGASAVMASAACRRPTEQIVPAVIQSPEYFPGLAEFYTTTAPDGTGLVVRSREGRPIKIAGNPDHPLTHGGVSAWNVASIMDLYDPDRQRKAARIKNGRIKKATEDELVSELQNKISAGSYVLMTGPVNSPSSQALINSFLDRYPGGRHVVYRQDPTLRQIAEGQKASYGSAIVPNYRFEKADFILTIEADFMGSMPGSTYFSSSYGMKRDVQRLKNINRLVAFESMFTATGGSADNRYPIRPGDGAAVALAIASRLIVEEGKSNYAGNGAVKEFLRKYTPEKVAATTGVSAETINGIAAELWSNRGNGLVIGGSPLAATGNDVSLQIAVNLLNSALENDGKTVDYSSPMGMDAGVSDREIRSLISDMNAGRVKTLIVAGANPVYHLPASFGFADAAKKVDYIATLSDRVDETGELADAILPSSHYLESWGDSEPVSGVYSVRQPVLRPLYETRSLEDRLIQLADGSLNGSASFHEFLKERWSKLQSSSGVGGSFKSFWNGVLQTGYFVPNKSRLRELKSTRSFNTSSLSSITRVNTGDGMKLGFYYSTQVLDGAGANNSYRQELPESMTKVVWTNAAYILPATARRMGIKQGNVIAIKTENGTLRLPAYLMPGIHPDAIIAALGYGRERAGRVAANVGTNVVQVANASTPSVAYSGLAVSSVEKTGKKEKIAATQKVYRTDFNVEDRAFFSPGSMPDAPYGGSSQYDRPLIREANLSDYKKDPHTFHPEGVEIPENANLMKRWDYTGNRWHLVMDLNQCIGCGACVTSCNLENNIPMVGAEQVFIGREMHWLRIDRYFSGSEENPEVAHQPMGCQQCENAPCENVCPVNATQHNSEGLNVMAYNRCIGTRYCANNCPYKVRRFNWFENWNKAEGFWKSFESPQNLAFNPEVSVRSRGVMEKCTFCIHRINEARAEYQAADMDIIPDGVLKTACQEVCPTGAITFGNVNDKGSKVFHIVSKDTRRYQVLDFLDTRPSITYLARIRNKKA